MTAHRRAAQRLTTGGATLTRRAAQWAARNRLTAAATAVVGAPTALNTLHRTPELAAAAAAGWLWAAWRAGRTPTVKTAGQQKVEGAPESGGVAGITDIKTVNGTATMTPDPTHPNRTNIRWDKP